MEPKDGQTYPVTIQTMLGQIVLALLIVATAVILLLIIIKTATAINNRRTTQQNIKREQQERRRLESYRIQVIYETLIIQKLAQTGSAFLKGDELPINRCAQEGNVDPQGSGDT